MMNVKRFSLLIIMSAVFLANIYLLSVYTDGDLYFYRKFYESLYRESWLEITTIQQMATGSAEPIYGQVAWVGSNLNIDHDVLISLFNTLLLFLIHRVLSHYRASVAFRVLVFSNYYILVLLTGAERLKFGFVLALLSCLIERDLLKKIVAFLMPLAHSQMSAHLLAIVVSRVSIPSGVGKISIKSFLRGVAMLVIVVAVAGLIYVKVGDVIVGKIGYYSEVSNKYESMVKILGIALVGFFAFKNKKEFLISEVVLIAVTYIAGSDRFQISALALLAYHAIVQRRTNNILILGVMAYFSFKSISFIDSVLDYGHGFGQSRSSVVD